MAFELFERYASHIKVVGPEDKVFKDECVCSFETAFDEGGLYISLTTFEAVSPDYLDYYFERYGNAVYLLHKKKKVECEGPRLPAPKRLAIGVEGGFDPDAGQDYKIEESYHVVLIPSGERYRYPSIHIPEFVKKSVESIINAESSDTRGADKMVWDGEQRQVSVWANNLKQIEPAPKVPPSGWKCEKCDLTENLWLNLTDGSILCGRKFFDGTGGNNHAVDHYYECNHPLAVKLGTITASSADVYSYPEEDMVIDPLLDKHLAHFGIDIQKMTKTEKSMLELEIDINEKLGEWSVIQEEGKNLKPVCGPGFTGLINLGNSCYMNSVLQVLFSIESFQRRYFPPSEVYCYSDGVFSFNHQMAKLAFGLLSGKYSEIDPNTKHQKGIPPKSFKKFVCGLDRNFSTARQQDAHEFFLFVIDHAERNAKENLYLPGSTIHPFLTTDPSKCFEFVIEDRIQCLESGKVKYTHRVECCLPLHVDLDLATNLDEVQEYKRQLEQAKDSSGPQPTLVRPKIPLLACVELFAKSETITDFYSAAVKKHTSADKTSKVSRFPRYFVFQMKKFQCGDDWVPKKLDVAFDVPDVIDLEFLEGRGLQQGEEELEESDPTTSDPTTSDPSEVKFDPEDVEADSIAVALLLSMGIDTTDAVRGLKATNNDPQKAIEWIFDPANSKAARMAVAHRSDPMRMKVFFPDDKLKLYQLKAFISHMGTSTVCGHYVCHIKKDESWYIFNDNKVALSENPPKELGYLYFYERISS